MSSKLRLITVPPLLDGGYWPVSDGAGGVVWTNDDAAPGNAYAIFGDQPFYAVALNDTLPPGYIPLTDGNGAYQWVLPGAGLVYAFDDTQPIGFPIIDPHIPSGYSPVSTGGGTIAWQLGTGL